jgi:hypothetical protein
MAKLDLALRQLRDERRRAQQEVEKLDQAIAVVQGLVGRNGLPAASRTTAPKRVMSAEARRKIAAAQRARWAKFRAKREKKAA